MSLRKDVSRVSIGALGGTITMAAAAGRDGVVPTLSAESLVASIPELREISRLSTSTLSKLPGASLTPNSVTAATDWAATEVEQGSAGVVVAQGTDTLEETAYLAHLYWNRPEPLVFTGAMRAPDQPSADGPANLLAACRVAVDEACRDVGVVLVMDNEIHLASTVRKEHSTALSAFTSPAGGPIGTLVEGQVHRYRTVSARPPLPRPTWQPYVPLLETFLGDDGATLRAVREAGAHGVVIGAFGVGHVSAALAAEIELTATHVPVVVSSRTSAGGTLRQTYGFEGSEMDLLSRGAVLSGHLDQRKSRVLLWALLAGGAARQDVVAQFSQFSSRPRCDGTDDPGRDANG